MFIFSYLRLITPWFLLLASFGDSFAGDPAQKQLRPVLKMLKKAPSHPLPWFRLAQYAERKGAHKGALETSLLALERLANQNRMKKPKQRVSELELKALMERAAANEARVIIASRSRTDLALSIPKGGMLDLGELQTMLNRKNLPRRFKKASFYGESHPTPINNTSHFEQLLTTRIAFYQKYGLEQAYLLLTGESDAYQREKAAYQLAERIGANDLSYLLTFINKGSRRFRNPAREDYAQITINNALERAKSESNARAALYDLLVHRAKLGSEYIFDQAAKKNGIHYLKNIEFTLRDVVLNEKVLLESTSLGFLGDIDTYGYFASVAKKGEMVIRSDNYLRGLVTHKSLTQTPRLTRKVRDYRNKEVWGGFGDFKYDKDLSDSQIFTTRPPRALPERYSPCTLVDESTRASGGLLGGISNFIEDHPLASALIAGTAAYLLTRDSSSSSSYSAGNASSSNQHTPRSSLKIGTWSSWLEHSPLIGGQHREAWVTCPNGLQFQVEEHVSDSGKHWFQRDTGAVLLPKHFKSLAEFVETECAEGSGFIDRDRR